jgi:hypothetical protein
MLRAEDPRIIRATIVTATAIEVLGDEDIVVLIVCGVVLGDFVIRDLCKVYYFICMYVRYILAQVQISLQLNSENFGATYYWCGWA